jgi:hypothetical protein
MINQKLKGIAHYERLIAMHVTRGLYQEPVSIAEVALKHPNGVEETKYYRLDKQSERISERYAGILLNRHTCNEHCYKGA